MELSYEYATGAVRARELKLLKHTDIEQLLAAGSAEQLSALLRDKGYGDAASAATVDQLLESQTRATWAYVQSVAPDFSVFGCFLCRNDAHNLKLTIKGVLRGIPYENLLLSPATISTATIRQAVTERKFELLPDWMATAAGISYDVMAGAGDAQLGDAVIDKATMAQMLATAGAVHSAFLLQYITMTVFYTNIKIALRAARTNKTAAFLESALCPCEGLDQKELTQAVLTGETELVERLSKRDVFELPAAMEAYHQSPSAFEKWVDDRLLREAMSCKYVAVGPEPLIGYYLAREAENRVVHIVASGLRAGQPEGAIRERLRELYG